MALKETQTSKKAFSLLKELSQRDRALEDLKNKMIIRLQVLGALSYINLFLIVSMIITFHLK